VGGVFLFVSPLRDRVFESSVALARQPLDAHFDVASRSAPSAPSPSTSSRRLPRKRHSANGNFARTIATISAPMTDHRAGFW
jgi:hypothetical protein